MAAFSDHHLRHPFHRHPPPFPNITASLKMSEDDFSQFYHPREPSPLSHIRDIQVPENESSLTNKQTSEASIVEDKVESGEQVTQKRNSREKKRKKKNGSVSSSVQCKRKRSEKKRNEKEVAEEAPPTGYIHVRARRGQATDSHSLAERVRREKISERMKTLQRLVPGCDKVTGKALVLDEIINYVQTLQSQVEFLSMKLATVYPLAYQFEHDLDSFMVTTESMSGSMGSSDFQCSGFTNYVSNFSDYGNMMLGGGEANQKLIISPAPSNNFCFFDQ